MTFRRTWDIDVGFQLTHGGALSNLPLLLALDARLFSARGLDLTAPALADFGSTAMRLRSGAAPLGTTGFTQVLSDAEAPDPLVIVAGSGLRGMAVVGRPNPTPREASGTLLTFADDPMAVLAQDVMQSREDLSLTTLRYATSLAEAAETLRTGSVAAITTVEPWISRLQAEGFTILSDGTDVWGPVYPDTVLVARRSFIMEERPRLLLVIDALLEAEAMIQRNPHAALGIIAHRFPSFTLPELELGLRHQPPLVDLRGHEGSVLGRWTSVRRLAGLPALPVPAGLIDFSCLAEAVAQRRSYPQP